MSAARVRALDDAGFDREVASHEWALVDFWADWCQPCHAMKPVLEQFAHEESGRIAVFTVDIIEQTTLAERFAVTSLPTLIFLRRGEIAARTTGAKRTAQLHRIAREVTAGTAERP